MMFGCQKSAFTAAECKLVISNYLRHGRYILPRVFCLSVCLSFCPFVSNFT